VDAPCLDGCAADRQRHVERLARQLRLQPRGFQYQALRFEIPADDALEFVIRRAFDLALFDRHRAEGGQEEGDAALLAERSDADRLELGFIGCGLDRFQRIDPDCLSICHGRFSQPAVRPFSPCGRRCRPKADG